MGGYRRDRSFGKNPVIEVKTNTIYEFSRGSSAYPFVEKGGKLFLNKIISVDNYSKNTPNVFITDPGKRLYDEWKQTLAKSLKQGDKIILDNYTEQTEENINSILRKGS